MEFGYVYSAYGVAGVMLLGFTMFFFNQHRKVCERLNQLHD